MTEDMTRYSRQILLPEIGLAGQERLRQSSVLVVGAGGLGSPVALYLAAAGVGRIGLVDPDRVEVSNLHRQVLYGTADVGRPKVEAAAERVHALNPTLDVAAHPVRLDVTNADDLLAAYDVVADGTDTFATRYVVNDASVRTRTPNVFASVSRFDGQASVFGVPGGPCYRCLFPEPPPDGLVPSCADGGVLGVLPGLLGMIQATEALKVLLGIGEPLVGRLLLVDARSMAFRTLMVDPDPACPVCHAETRSSAAATPPTLQQGRIREIAPQALRDRLDGPSPPFLLDVRRPEEKALADLGGANIPLNQLPWRIGELDAHRDDELLAVYCRSGGRSAQAAAYLQEKGFRNVVSLRGGTLAWSDEVDPSLPTS